MKGYMFLLVSILLIFLSCFPQHKEKSRILLKEAKLLQQKCKDEGISEKLIHDADSLLSDAKKFYKEMDYGDSYKTLDKAKVYYTLALTNNTFVQSQKGLDTLKKSIEDIKEELASVERILEKLEIRKGGQR